jgi:hypothetical protein
MSVFKSKFKSHCLQSFQAFQIQFVEIIGLIRRTGSVRRSLSIVRVTSIHACKKRTEWRVRVCSTKFSHFVVCLLGGLSTLGVSRLLGYFHVSQHSIVRQ